MKKVTFDFQRVTFFLFTKKNIYYGKGTIKVRKNYSKR